MEGVAVTANPDRVRVLLTGAAGFIGSHLARLLVGLGHEVTAIIRPGEDCWRIRDIAGSLLVLEGDLTELPALLGPIRRARPEVCLHLAWQGWSGKAEAEANLSSLGLSLELLRAMPQLECRRFVAAGTCFEYDLTLGRLTESTPLRPHDLYGTCKKSLFEVAREFSLLTGVSVATPRIFYSYGPDEDCRRLVPSITQALLRGESAAVTRGEQVRDYLHVEDVASAFWAVASSDLTGAVNIASGEPVTIAQVATRIGQIVGAPAEVQLGALPYREGEPMHILGDVRMLRQHLGWTPRFNLETGLAQTVEWWRARETHD